jgi:peptidyl-prolyl cis-trans isomerase SurA
MYASQNSGFLIERFFSMKTVFLILTIIAGFSNNLFSRNKELKNSQTVDKIVASVNSDVILLSDIENFKKNYKEYYFSISPGSKMEDILKNKNEILDILIDNVLLDQAISEMNLNVSDIMLKKRIESIIKQNKIDENRLKLMANEEGVSYDTWKENYRKSMERHMLIEQEIKPRVAVNDFDLRNYYNSKVASMKKETEVELIDFVSKGDKKSLLGVKRLLDKGEKLDKVKSSCANNCTVIDLGFMNKGSLLPEMARALVDIKKGKKYTEIIEINGIYHLAFIKSTRSAGLPPFEAVKDKLYEQYYQVALEKEILNWLTERKKSSFIEKK